MQVDVLKAWGVDTIYKLSVFLRGDADPGLRGVEERFLPPPIALYVDSSEWSGCDISELRRYSRIPSEPVAHYGYEEGQRSGGPEGGIGTASFFDDLVILRKRLTVKLTCRYAALRNNGQTQRLGNWPPQTSFRAGYFSLFNLSEGI